MLTIKKIIKREDGGVDATYSFTEEQTIFLLSYAVSTLLAQGVLNVEEVEQEDEDTVGSVYIPDPDNEQVH